MGMYMGTFQLRNSLRYSFISSTTMMFTQIMISPITLLFINIYFGTVDTVGSRQTCPKPYYIVDSRQNCAQSFWL